MKRNIQVFVGTNPILVGYLLYNQDGQRENSAFEYARSWINDPKSFSIDPSLPLVSGPQFYKKTNNSCFHPIISESEPDGWGKKVILRAVSKKKANTTGLFLNSFDFLVSVSDETRLGALRFKEEGGNFLADSTMTNVPPLIELNKLLLSTKAIEENNESDSDIEYLMGDGTSLGGIRPKCMIIDNDKSLWIAKFPSITDERSVTKGEVLAMQLAKLVGLKVSEAKLVPVDGSYVALIKRFDRINNNRRIFLSAHGMLDAGSDSSENMYCYTDIVNLLRINALNPQTEILELWKRIAFSIMISNFDDHLKNHGFLHVNKEFWELSPAYDLNPFPDKAKELKTWISQNTGPSATYDALLSETPYFGLDLKQGKAIIEEMKEVVSTWKSLAKKLNFSNIEIKQFETAFNME